MTGYAMNRPAPELLLTPPPGFVGLPLHADEQATLTPHSGERATGLPRYVTWFAHLLAEEDIRLYGRFAVVDGVVDAPVLADLAVAVAPWDGDDRATVRGNRDVAVARLRKQYLARQPHADVRVLRLAIGPAMVAVTAGQYRLPPDVTRHGQDVLPRISAEFQIPTPDGTHVALMTVSTANEAGCQGVLTTAMRVAYSIRVTRPRHDATAVNPSA